MTNIPLWLGLPDEDALKPADVTLLRQLRPAGFLAMRYDWDSDKGAAEQVIGLVQELGHRDLLVRFERRGGTKGIPQIDPGHWAENCFDRMRLYDPLRPLGVTLHCIPANEMNLPDPEGGHKDWARHAAWMSTFATRWKQLSGDPLHLPAPARLPIAGVEDWTLDNESIRYWQAMRAAGVHTVVNHVDCHAYRQDFLQAIGECISILGVTPWVTECNGMPMSLAVQATGNSCKAAVWFISDWRNYAHSGVPRTEELPENGGVHMSIAKWPELYSEWLALAPVAPIPVPAPVPIPPPPAPPLPPESPMKAYTNDEIRAVTRQAAAAHGIQELLLLACGIAEGGLRQFARRPKTPAKDAASWPDVSFGIWQQSVRWANEYRGGNDYPGDAEVARIGSLYFDVPHAADVAAAQLARFWDGGGEDASLLRALAQYNWPGGRGKPRNATVAKNYQNGLAAAHALLDAPLPPGPEVHVPNYQFGIKTLADQLGADVVGQPLGDEQYVTPDYSLQMSEKGVFFYSKQGNRVLFLPARLA